MSGSHRASVQRRRSAGPAAADPPGGAAGPGPRQQSRGQRRRARKRRGRATAGTAALLMAAVVGWFAFGPGGVLSRPSTDAAQAQSAPGTPLAHPGQRAARPAPTALTPEAPTADRSDRADGTFASIPGLGAKFGSMIPAGSNQVVLASGAGKDSSDSAVTLWSRTPDGRWRPGTTWTAHNGYSGWTADHSNGDLRSPIGVFTLSDAGGLKTDPGSHLPYHQDNGFVAPGNGFNGEPLAGAFDYVIAIDYNRVTGSSPLDPREPQGASKGGGIWLHVDHGGPTHACVSLSEDRHDRVDEDPRPGRPPRDSHG